MNSRIARMPALPWQAAVAWMLLAFACEPAPGSAGAQRVDATSVAPPSTPGAPVPPVSPPMAAEAQVARAGDTSASGFPRTVTLSDGTSLLLQSAPRRIVPASAGLCDLVCALVPADALAGLPAQADDYADLAALDPAYAARPRFVTFAAEPLLLLKPDLVIVDAWGSPDTGARLREAGVTVVTIASLEHLSDVREAARVLGQVFGREAQASALVAALDAREAALATGAAARRGRRALVYSNGGSGGWVAGAGTAADEWLALAGFTNAAGDLPGHRRCNFEELLRLDPDLLVLSGSAGDHPTGATARLLRSESVLARLRAVEQGLLVELPPRLHDGVGLSIVAAAERLAQLADAVLPPR